MTMTVTKNAGAGRIEACAAALAWAAAGYPVFPCWNTPENVVTHKAPLTPHGFKDATTNPEQIKAWWTKWPTALIGMPCGRASGMIVTDIDRHVDRPNGFEHLPQWAELSNHIAKTAGDGRHLYYADDGQTGIVHPFPGVEVRGEGHYVILPGSEGYEWEHGGDLNDLQPVPAFLLNGKGGEPHTSSAEPEANIGDVTAALVIIPNDDLDWESWNNIGMATWRATGGDGFEAFDAFSQKSTKYDPIETRRRWDHYHRSPPTRIGAGTIFFLANKHQQEWEAKHLAPCLDPNNEWLKSIGFDFEKFANDNPIKLKLDWGGGYQQEEDEANGEEHEAESEAPKAEVKSLFQSSGEFVKAFTPPDYSIDGLMQRRFVYALTAPMGRGKTTVVLRIAMHCALGLPIGNREVDKVKVLFLAGENPDDIRMRWIKLCEKMGQEPDAVDVYFLPGVVPLAATKMRARINAEAAEKGPFGVVIADTSAAYFEGDNENDNAQMIAHAKVFRSLVNLPGGPSIIVTCHPKLNANEDSLVPRGGSGFLGEIDCNLVLKARASMVVDLHWHQKMRGPDFPPIPFLLTPGTSEKIKDARAGRFGRSLRPHLANHRQRSWRTRSSNGKPKC